MQSDLLVGSEKFMSSLAEISSKAKESFYVQAMTFEGDEAGEQLIATMNASPAADKRLLIDSYSKVVINDHFVHSSKYLFDSTFRSEVKNTRRLIKRAKESGIQVKFTNPVGFLMVKYPLRNHKKMVIVDKKVSYLGGINFSDHNFEWHDMMIKMEDGATGDCLAEDFLQTWAGENQSDVRCLDGIDIYFLNRTSNLETYKKLFGEIQSAKKSVKIISPYLSEPLLSILKSLKEIDILVVSPSENNKSLFTNLMLQEHSKGSFDLRWYPGMSHVKAILVDDEKLIFGSSNFDFVSFLFEQEIVAVSKDPKLVEQFKSKFFHEDYAVAETKRLSGVSRFKVSLVSSLGKALTRPSRFIG